jgi:ribosomal protein L7/L12
MPTVSEVLQQIDALTPSEQQELIQAARQKYPVVCSGCGRSGEGPHACPGRSSTEQYEFCVTLVSVGPNRIATMRLVRSLLNLGVNEARILIDIVASEGSRVLKSGTSRMDATEMRHLFHEVGAQVTVT